jgi:tellurite resistance protein
MMDTVGHYVYFMQLTIASSDGEVEQEEIDEIIERAVEQQLFSQFTGIPVDQGPMVEEACRYHDDMVNSGQIRMAFASAAGGVASTLNYDSEVLSIFYDSMVSVAASDGVIEGSERELLDYLRAEWGL